MMRRFTGELLAVVFLIPILPLYGLSRLGEWLTDNVGEWRMTAWLLNKSEAWVQWSQGSPKG